MTKLTLGQAAKHASRAKSTISKALKNGQLSGEKINKAGRESWQIDPSELQRWMDANPIREQSEVQNTTPVENTENGSANSALETELRMLRERLELVDEERERERSQNDEQKQQLIDQIEALQKVNEEQRIDFRQSLAAITDQRDRAEAKAAAQEAPRKGFFARLTGR